MPFTFASCFGCISGGEGDWTLLAASEEDLGLTRTFSTLSGFDSVRSSGFFAFGFCSLVTSVSTDLVLVFFFFFDCSGIDMVGDSELLTDVMPFANGSISSSGLELSVVVLEVSWSSFTEF
jgi:hypothetical protein